MKVRDRFRQLEDLGATALFVVHDDPTLVRRLLLAGAGEPPFPILVDRARETYRRWGLRRAPWWRIWLDPNVWRQYLELLRARSHIRGSGADTLQLGGDFIVDAEGTVVYSRPQRHDDRPPVGELLSILAADRDDRV